MPAAIGDEIGRWSPSDDDDGNGTTTLNDLSGNANHGTLTDMDAASDWVTDTANGGVRALDFDGSNDQVAFSGTLLPSNTPAATIAYWMRRPTASTFGPYFGLGNGTITNRMEFEPYNDNQLYVTFTSGIYAWIALDQDWHHYAAVFDGSEADNESRLKIYKDGVLQAPDYNGTIPTTIGASALSLRLGRGQFGNFGAGRIDDARVFDRALTGAEVELLAAERGTDPALVVEDSQTRSVGDEPNAGANYVLTVVNAQSRSVADEPVADANFESDVVNSQTLSVADEPAADAFSQSPVVAARTRSVGDEPAAGASFDITIANGQSRSRGNSPAAGANYQSTVINARTRSVGVSVAAYETIVIDADIENAQTLSVGDEPAGATPATAVVIAARTRSVADRPAVSRTRRRTGLFPSGLFSDGLFPAELIS
jgi:hypothetical protein